MTKKRFIKLLMSHGEQRNEAQIKAMQYNSRNIPYAKAYRIYLAFDLNLRKLKAAAAEFANGIRQGICSILKLKEGAANDRSTEKSKEKIQAENQANIY